MNRIGILTFHRAINNGAVIQCYSLSKRIKKDFPNSEVEVIDYNLPKEEESYSASLKNYYRDSSFKGFVFRTGSFMKDPLKLYRINKRNNVFRSVLEYLPLSPDTILDNDFNSVFQYINERYDVLIVGSDAVWNFVSRGYPNAYLPDSFISIPKLSYAASCYGMDYLEIGDEDKAKIKDSLNDFSFIGVRDNATENFVEWSGCIHSANHTCDPTAFLDVNCLPVDEALLKEKLEKKGFSFERPSIGLMGNKQMFKMVKQLYGNDYQIVSLYNYIKGADVQLYDINPYEWAYVFRFFKFTITTYFHGTMLSLRNGVPVICCALNTEFAKKHVPKTLDLLSRLNFESWYFKTDYKDFGVSDIKSCADRFLQSDYSDVILSALNREAESYFCFKDALQKVINTQK